MRPCLCICNDRKVFSSRAGKMDSKMSATMVDRQGKFSNSRRCRMAKTIIFWPWWQPFNSFCFETLPFLPLSPFFLFATQKSEAGGRKACLPSVASPGSNVCIKLHCDGFCFSGSKRYSLKVIKIQITWECHFSLLKNLSGAVISLLVFWECKLYTSVTVSWFSWGIISLKHLKVF